MKKIIGISLIATLALSSLQAVSNEELAEQLNDLTTQVKKLKKKVKRQTKKINKVRAHDAGDNIKWNVDFRTSIDNITYKMADGSEQGKNDLMSNRLWLNMAYSPDNTNVFKAQLSYNKAYGADFKQTPNSSLNPFGVRGTGLDTFDWVTQEALTDGSLKVRQAYWLYLGEDMGESIDIPWTMSLGRRPSTGGFLANLRNDDPAQSPLGHIINVEFDGLSSKLDLSNVTGISGMSFKICAGQGSTNAVPRMGNLAGTDYANDDANLEDTQLGGFIFEPYNDGQYIIKTTGFKAFNMPGFDGAGFYDAFNGNTASFTTVGNMLGGAVSVLIDGLTEDGFLADVKLFGSYAVSKTDPDAGKQMLGIDMEGLGHVTGAKFDESKTGYSLYAGAQLPITEEGIFGIEYNHGSKYWRPYTYAEDTFAGSKLAARGDAFEGYFTYQINSSLSAQLRYTNIDYKYTGSNGFFASAGTPFEISDIQAGDKAFKSRGLTDADMASLKEAFGVFEQTGNPQEAGAKLTQKTAEAIGAINGGQPKNAQEFQAAGTKLSIEALKSSFASQVVEKAEDIRFYIRYRF